MGGLEENRAEARRQIAGALERRSVADLRDALHFILTNGRAGDTGPDGQSVWRGEIEAVDTAARLIRFAP